MADVFFVIHDPWLRDHYRCDRCGTIPQNRALVNALNCFAPNWRDAALHESSPGAVDLASSSNVK
jgi:hypothetical protein